jgi:hypothetical protein
LRELGSSLADALKRRHVGHYSIIVLVASALTAIWFRSGLVIAYAESGLYIFNPDAWREFSFYVWTDRVSTGTSSLGIAIPSLPFHLGLTVLQIIGLTPFQRQVTLFFGLLAVSGLSMYYLVLGSFSRYQRALEANDAALLASLFYILNPYSMIYVWNRNTVTMNVSYAVLPLALGLFVRGLESKKTKFAFYTSIALTAASGWVSILPILVPVVLFSFLMFRIFVSRKDKREIFLLVRYSALLSITWVLMNMWFVPYYATSLSRLWWGFSSNYSQRFLSGFPILDVIRLNFNFSSNGVFWPFYQTIFGEGLGVIMVGSVLGGLIVRIASGFRRGVFRRKDISYRSKMIAYYSALAISGLSLGSVALTPLKNSVGVVLQVLPLSASISNNLIGEKAIFLAVLGYSVLFGLAMSSLGRKLRNPVATKTLPFQLLFRRTLVGLLLLSVLVLNVWPMWTGDVFTQPYLPSSAKLPDVRVPEYYAQASTWLNGDPSDFRVLALPFVDGGITYNWLPNGYSGSTTDFILLTKPMIMEANDPTSNSLIHAVSYYITSDRWSQVPPLLSLLSVKYIMVHEDINFSDRRTLNPAVIEASLNSTMNPYLNVDPVRDDYGHPIASSPQDWATTWGSPPEFIGNASTTANDWYVHYDGYSDGLGNVGFGPTFAKALNLSDTRWLDMSIQTNVSGTLFIAITDVNGRQTFFDGRATPQYILHSSKTWSNFTLPLNAPSYENQNFDLSRIRSILIAQVGLPSDVAVDLKVKDVLIDHGVIGPSLPGIQFARRIGKLAFYEIGRTNNIVYPTTSFSVVNESLPVAEAAQSGDYETNHTLFINSQFADTSQLKAISQTHHGIPLIRAIRINPVTWVVQVRNSSGPFILVFGQTFDPNWKLYFGEQSWFWGFSSPHLDERLHYLANGFANAWYIDRTGDFMITVYFSPQSLVSIGVIVSLLASLALLIWTFWRNVLGPRGIFRSRNSKVRTSNLPYNSWKGRTSSWMNGRGFTLNE